jgi:hypothetical protein
VHDLCAELNSTHRSNIIRPPEVHAEAVLDQAHTDLGLGVYGHGTCLHSLDLQQQACTLEQSSRHTCATTSEYRWVANARCSLTHGLAAGWPYNLSPREPPRGVAQHFLNAVK